MAFLQRVLKSARAASVISGSHQIRFAHSFQYLEVSKEGPVTVISMNRPEVKNCVNKLMASELLRAFVEFDKDANASVGVLYGKGGSFCSGYDLKEVAALSDSTEEQSKGLLKDFKDGHAPMVRREEFVGVRVYVINMVVDIVVKRIDLFQMNSSLSDQFPILIGDTCH